MAIHAASLPGGAPPGQDRWTVTPHGIIVLDGATAVAPGVPPAEQYVDALLEALSHRLDHDTDLRAVIAEAIAAVAYDLALTPGEAPSSTVAVLRWTEQTVDVAVLGDSSVIVGDIHGAQTQLTDDRLAAVAPGPRNAYQQRLRQGYGYGGRHHDLMTEVQRVEVSVRNTERGYWIAEADRVAGCHAEVRQFPCADASWAALATDGAQQPIDHAGIAWADISAYDDEELAALLDELHRWEAESDPDGQQLPRAKRHDDKTLVTWQPDR